MDKKEIDVIAEIIGKSSYLSDFIKKFCVWVEYTCPDDVFNREEFLEKIIIEKGKNGKERT